MATESTAVSEEKQGSLLQDGSRKFVHPADVTGRFTRLRWVVFGALIAIYAALPWITVGGHPAVFLDIQRRRFYLFGETFNAQDAWLVFFLVSGVGFALIAMTALWGRVWCGYACPQTVFLEGFYRRVERWIEGPREQRIRRNAAPLSFDKVWRKVLKHAMFAALSLLVAHIFLSYFTSLDQLFQWVRLSPAEHPEAFGWMAGISILMYLNFAWFREQFCLIVCPYGRLQSVLTDRDSIIIGYDVKRGEPRGKVGKEGAGDCVDCRRCVVVCPTAIDIRHGLQLECVGCAACIDACDEIMDKVGRPRGLVRYDSQAGLDGKPRRFWRPRLALYAVLGLVGLVVATFSFASRTQFEANLLRAQGPPFVVDGAVVRNTFNIHLVNKSPQRATLVLRAEGGDGFEYLIPVPSVPLASLASINVPVIVTAPLGKVGEQARVKLTASMEGVEGEQRELVAPFLAPRHAGGERHDGEPGDAPGGHRS
ncbi:MAG: cytochrome c oxidase accessory protein CcoG [Deltaproteobacteria bacterium]|nr:cytochrome c oxidase accessory protein CcoG [Deltaproteobacteria bacterium]